MPKAALVDIGRSARAHNTHHLPTQGILLRRGFPVVAFVGQRRRQRGDQCTFDLRRRSRLRVLPTVRASNARVPAPTAAVSQEQRKTKVLGS